LGGGSQERNLNARHGRRGRALSPKKKRRGQDEAAGRLITGAVGEREGEGGGGKRPSNIHWGVPEYLKRRINMAISKLIGNSLIEEKYLDILDLGLGRGNKEKEQGEFG